jgi:hypothetical protein
VKYMMLLYMNPDSLAALSEEERNQIFSEVDEVMAELQKSGEWVGGEALADPSQSKVVKSRSGVPAVTDGPYLEAKEQFAGFCMIECETEQRAIEIAARWPDARYNGVELRRVMTPSGTEM